MNAATYTVILFHTSNHAFRAEKVLKDQQLVCRLIPVPRHLSSDCGVCARIDGDQAQTIENILIQANVEYASIHII